MNAEKKDGIERCAQMCERSLVNADKAMRRDDVITADYWTDSAAQWSARAFDWVTL